MFLQGHCRLICLFMVFVAPTAVHGQPIGNTFCTVDEETVTIWMSVKTNDSIINDIFVSDVFSVPYDECPITGTGTSDDPYIAQGTYNFVTGQPVGPDCGIQFDAQQQQFFARIRTCREINRSREGDVMFQFLCDSDGSIPQTVSLDLEVQLPNLLNTIDIPIDNLELAAVTEGNDLIEEIALGDPFYIRLEFKKDTSTNLAYAMVGAYCKTLLASPDNVFETTTFDILDPDSGCPQQDSSFMYSPTNLVYKPEFSNLPRLHSSRMGPLAAARFDKIDSNLVYFACDAGFCFLNSDLRCRDYCQYRLDEQSAAGKRRRSVNNSTFHNTIYTSIRIVDKKKVGLFGLPATVTWVLVAAATIVIVVGILSCLMCVMVRRKRRRKNRRSKYEKQTNTASSASVTTKSDSRSSSSKTSYSKKFSHLPKY